MKDLKPLKEINIFMADPDGTYDFNQIPEFLNIYIRASIL